MITYEEVLKIHKILIGEFGGSLGVRDSNGLDSALARPYMTFDQIELYPTPEDKAAAILQSILINHPFIDGNKRTGYVLMRLQLLKENFDIIAEQEDKYEFVISITEGKLNIDQIRDWIRNRIVEMVS